MLMATASFILERNASPASFILESN
uniref:Uncharacterized protein n=1 Tax=Rhizophora mucronata TaxID=61149 RepID=A0A2P2P8W3_RHIMU